MNTKLKINDNIIVHYKGKDKAFGTLIKEEEKGLWLVKIAMKNYNMYVPKEMLKKVDVPEII